MRMVADKNSRKKAAVSFTDTAAKCQVLRVSDCGRNRENREKHAEKQSLFLSEREHDQAGYR